MLRRIVFVTLALCAVLQAASAFSDPFHGWARFGGGDDNSIWYYYPGSAKRVNHIQTGRFVGVTVWAGWKNPDGSYAMVRIPLMMNGGAGGS